jgi:MFS transporter, ACS family, hexuronate transporter
MTGDGMNSAAVEKTAVGRFRWVILGLLFGAAMINYMDRFLLGQLKPIIVNDLHWTETDYANVVFCFQLAYAIGLLTVGRMVDKLGVRLGLSLVVILCAIAAASHAFAPAIGNFCVANFPFIFKALKAVHIEFGATAVVGFCIVRFMLGFGESGTWPACAKAVGEWFPRKERAVGMGFVNAGSSIGATIAPMLVPMILKLVAWPFAFLFTAALDVIWLCIWLIGYRSPEKHPLLKKAELDYIRSDASPQGEVPWILLFGHRQTWAFAIAKGLSDPVWWFYLFWVPGFLAEQYGLKGETAAQTVAAMAVPIMVIYIMADLGSICGGWVSMKLINRGWSINAARKTVMLCCACGVAPVFLVPWKIGLWPSVFLIGLAAASHLAFSANLFTVATDTVPKHAVSSVAGIGGMVAAVGAMFMAKFVGFILDTTHSYILLFGIAACAYFVALGILHLLLPKLEPMKLEETTT